MTEKERSDPHKMSLGDVLAVASNRKTMSCMELSLGTMQAMMLSATANPNLVKADADTVKVAAPIGNTTKTLIDEEEKCHCDRGAPMPGYELYERRNHLRPDAAHQEIRPVLAAFYPKNEAGQPRFLRYGEPISDEVLKRLPSAKISEPTDNCSSSCLEARKKVNAKATAEGKPEPWPNLQWPKKKPCTAKTNAAFESTSRHS